MQFQLLNRQYDIIHKSMLNQGLPIKPYIANEVDFIKF